MNLTTSIAFFAYSKIMHWVHQAGDYEVSGFGKVLRSGTHLHVIDAFLLKQRNTEGSTVLDAADTARAMYRTREEPGDFNFWWHSHANMEAFWSKTDYDAIKELGGNGWLLATVFNARRETQTALYVNQPVEFLTEHLRLEVIHPILDSDTQAFLNQQYKENVTHIVPVKRTENRDWEYQEKWSAKRWEKRMRRLERLRERGEAQRILNGVH